MPNVAHTIVQLDHYTAWLRASGRPQTTIDLRCYHIRRLARAVPDPLAATTEQLVDWLAGHAWAPATRRSYRSSLRTYYAWAHITSRITHDPARLLPAISTRAGIPRPAGEDCISAALTAAEPRVQLMIRLAAQAGLRRGEIAKVRLDDVTEDLDGWSLRVQGKGDRERLVPLTKALALALRASEAGWIFPSPGGGHLTPAHTGKLISRALGPGVTAHCLRHRFATRAYGAGQDLLSVQQLLGHAKPETTMIYTQIPAGAKRAIVDAAA